MNDEQKKTLIEYSIGIIIVACLLIVYYVALMCKYPECTIGREFGYSEYCVEHTCRLCNGVVDENSEYCHTHKTEQDIIEKKKKEKQEWLDSLPWCRVGGCDFKAYNAGGYCIMHGCLEESCSSRCQAGQSYCSAHICKNAFCDNVVEEKYSLCNSCKIKESNNKKGKTSVTVTKSTKKKIKKMPDCDDYDSYDDFMDDWDGRMPDGSNAEDYWENW